MASVRILHNPFEQKTNIFLNDKLIDNSQNRIISFSDELDFEDLLMPYKVKYKIWQGLLMEMILELEDDEIDFVFEGRQQEFNLLEEAFEKSKDIVISNGYGNNWTLSHLSAYEADNLFENILKITEEMKDYLVEEKDIMQLNELNDNLVNSSDPSDIGKAKEILFELIQNRLEQIERENSPWKKADTIMIGRIKNKIIEAFNISKLGGNNDNEQ